MFPIRNIPSLVSSWFQSRGFRLWTKYPMVAVLAIALTAISAQEAVGSVWCNVLFVLLVASAVGALLQSNARTPKKIAWQQICIAFALALFFGFYHSIAQRDAAQRLDTWEQNVRTLSQSRQLATVSWNPIACRGTIDSALRYRKSAVMGNQEDPAAFDWQTITTLQVTEIRTDGAWQPKSLLLPLSVDGKLEGLFPGDQIELYGQWRLPSLPTNPGQFNQAKRYAELGYAAQVRADSERQLKRLDRPHLLRLDRYLAMVSARALKAIEQNVILGQTELTAALVLGQREQAEWQLQEELLATGTIHMLSISGMHIEMVALSLLLMGMLLKLPRKPLLVGVCVFVIAYGLLCGANPPVARATIMLTGLCIAKLLGWSFSSLNFLAFAGVLLILYRTSVVFETGTQLSFMAVAVLILSTNSMPKRVSALERLIDSKSSGLKRWRKQVWGWSMESLRTSFWVWFITAPLVWSAFHVISPIAIALNLLLWLPMLLALIGGLGLIALGWMPVVNGLLGVVCGSSLWLLQLLVGWAEQLPLGHFWLRSPPGWWLYGFYGLGIACAAWKNVKSVSSRRRLRWVLGVWFLFGLAIQPGLDLCNRFLPAAACRLSFTFINVGHGTCILIETPDQEAWLYDAGRLGDHERSYQVIADTLWAMNKSQIDGLIVSHADSDHYNAIDGLAKRFSISKILSTSQVYSHASPLLQKNLAAIERRKVERWTWKTGSVLAKKSWNMLALHPPEQGVAGSDNANSLCVLIEFAGRRIFLPGDLEPPGMQLLVSQPITKVDVLMAPHHGSLNSKSDALLRWCEPETVVISGSTRAVSPRVLDSFAAENREVFVTARDHAIRIEIDNGGKIEKKQWVVDRWQTLVAK